MRATIEQSEKTTGLLRKTTQYIVTCKVEFSEEEKQIIKQRKLGDEIVLTWPINQAQNSMEFCRKEGITENTLFLKQLLEPITHKFTVPIDAKRHEEELTEALKTTKRYIAENLSVDTGVRTIEL